jgi:lathosterol oxidase
MVFSGGLFMMYYWKPTYEQWTRKTNPEFPSAEMVRDEVLQMLKGLTCAAICPALSLYLHGGISKAYCFGPDHPFEPLAHFKEFMVMWLVSDFFEFFYHWCGHYFSFLWQHHRPHHKFFNPSPFAVIADDRLDMFVRASPLLWMPLICPVNFELMFF